MTRVLGAAERSRRREQPPVSTAPRRQRLQRFLARAGIASRRRAEALIRAGRVQINGQPATELGTTVDQDRDRVLVDGRPVAAQSAVVHLALHKPVGVITTHSDPQGRPTVMELLPAFPGLLFVGRLDAESEGLLLATTDGRWGQRIQHPRYGCEKEYLVHVTGRLTPQTLRRLRRPLDLGDGDRSSGAQVTLIERPDEDTTATTPTGHHLRIVLREGRKRQIRRMCEAVGLTVRRLVRVRVGSVELGTLVPGGWRHLTPAEVETAATAEQRTC